MRFKHTFNVFVDNFSVTYKQLLYRLIISIIAGVTLFLGLSPFINSLIPELNKLFESVRGFIMNLLDGNVAGIPAFKDNVESTYNALVELLKDKTPQFILSGLLFLLVYLIANWFAALGNYAAAAVINEKMALRANSPFFVTLIKNLKSACVYSAVYVPLSICYDLIIGVAMFFFIFYLLNSFLPFFLCVFLFATIITFSIAVKMTFASDWLPALVRGKRSYKEAFIYTFARKNKNTFYVLSNFIVIILIILGLNVAALLCTLGVGLLITIPASYLILICFQLVNYYDREEIKYFVDKNTIIKPEKERAVTREEFFRGEED